jgi:hypothetical protein
MAPDTLAERRDQTVERLRGARHWLLLIVGGVAVALLPWTAYLSATLPSKHLTEHWDIAWAGLDLFEAASLILLFLVIVRRSPLVPMFAAVAGTALLCDAWFDLSTSGSRFYWALAEALAAELPLAALCFWLAFEVSEAIGLSAARDAASAAAPRPTLRPDRPEGDRAPARRAGSEAPSAGRTSR